MLRFGVQQKVHRVGGVEIGGQPGERPPVLVGSIFFAGHRIVHDPARGLFDWEKARALLEREEGLSEETGVPRFVDVVGDTAEALAGYVEFVAVHSRSPIIVDSPSRGARMGAIRHFAGSEVAERLIYNSIGEDRTDEEMACIRECSIRTAVLLAFGNRAVRPEGKLRLLEDDLLPAAARAGVENVLVDTGLLDVPSVSLACGGIRAIKESTGYPAGCAPANAIYTWDKMRARGTPAFQASAAAVFALLLSQGADFLFYGSLSNAPWVYPAVATAGALMSRGRQWKGSLSANHGYPLYGVF